MINILSVFFSEYEYIMFAYEININSMDLGGCQNSGCAPAKLLFLPPIF